MIGFEQPLAFLAVLPALAICAFLFWRSRKALQFISANTASKRRSALTILNEKTHATLFAAYLLLSIVLVVAVASPYLKADGAVTTETKGRVLIFLDASLSMQARDMEDVDGQSISRLASAKELASGIVERVESSRIGFYSFAGTVVVHSPPSNDREAVRSVVDAMGTFTAYVNTGSSLSAVLASIRSQAAQAAGSDDVIQAIILGDGEIPDGYKDEYEEDLAALQAAGVRVHAITIGQDSPTTINLFDPAQLSRDRRSKIRPTGTAKTRRVDEHYEDIADGTDGYFAAVVDAASSETALDEVLIEIRDVQASRSQTDPAARKSLTPHLIGLFLVLFLIEGIGLSIFRASRVATILFVLPLLSLVAQCDRLRSHTYNEKGIFFEALGDIPSARMEYERSRLYATGAGTASSNLGSLSGDADDFAEAHRQYEYSLKLDFDRPPVHYEDGRLLFLWASREAEECRLKRAEELLATSVVRFQMARELSAARGPLRRFYERYLLKEPEVVSMMETTDTEVAQLKERMEELKKTCPAQESQENQEEQKKQAEKQPEKDDPSNPENNPEKTPDEDQTEPGESEGVGGSVKPGDTIEARLSELKGREKKGEFRQSREQQGAGEEGESEKSETEPGEKGQGRPIWW